MSRFCSLYSSSKGNSTYLSGGGTSVLVDVGVSCKMLLKALAQRELAVENISGIVITHEHVDHVRGLKVLLGRYNIPLFATAGTLDFLIKRDMLPAGAVATEICNSFYIGDIYVTPFSTPHDSMDSACYRFAMPDGRNMAVATDLGHVTETVSSHLTGCDLVMLESNYDKGMLDCSHYPYHTKLRIKSDVGHLSNEDSAREISRLVSTGTTRIMLGHLSPNNNLPDIAYYTTKGALDKLNLCEGKDYQLGVASAYQPSKVIVF